MDARAGDRRAASRTARDRSSSLSVHTGTVGLDVGDHHVDVAAGDSAWFDATRPHAYANAGPTAATFALVVLEPAG